MSLRQQDQVALVQKIGRYQILGELGKGAMGLVYKAADPNIGRIVALKTMRLDVHGAEHDLMVQRFQNEARAAGVLNHSNIVTIYDAGEADGVFYIAMEYIEGRTLASILLEHRTLDAASVVEIGSQVCAGLQYAHFRNVVHRDIKPANIMIASKNGCAKIMDFGIAKAGGNLTHTGEVVGTPHYMSPEQVKGQELDGRSDIFSTGVMLYEMMTGEKPFNGDTVTTIIYRIVNENAVPPRELDVTIHPGLSQVVMKCLHKNPEQRYQEADDLATALKSYKYISMQEAKTYVGSLPIAINNTTAVPRVAMPKTQPMSPPPMNAFEPAPAARTAAAVKTATLAASTGPVTVSNTATVQIATLPTEERIQAPLPPAKGLGDKQNVLLMVLIAVLVGFVGFLLWTLRHDSKLRAAAEAKPTEIQAPLNDPAAQASSAIENATRKPHENAAGIVYESAPLDKPSPAVAGVGNLRLTSNPPGAQVTIDGVSQGWWVTPFNAPPMKAGMHSVTATAAGFPAMTKQVEVVANRKVVTDFPLAGDNAIYFIASLPNGANISIDGQSTGARTPAQISVKAGAHRVALDMEGFQPVELNTSASAGESVNLNPRMQAINSVNITALSEQETQSLGTLGRMKRLLGGNDIPAGKGMVQIKTRPKGATVTLEGQNITRPTPLRFPLPPGTYSVTIQKPGYHAVTRAVQVEEGKVVELEEPLVADGQ